MRTKSKVCYIRLYRNVSPLTGNRTIAVSLWGEWMDRRIPTEFHQGFTRAELERNARARAKGLGATSSVVTWE